MAENNYKQVDSNDLMKFLASFRNSMEEKIANTNDKIDGKMEKIEKEITSINDKMENMEVDNMDLRKRMKGAQERMEDRLDKLEK